MEALTGGETDGNPTLHNWRPESQVSGSPGQQKCSILTVTKHESDKAYNWARLTFLLLDSIDFNLDKKIMTRNRFSPVSQHCKVPAKNLVMVLFCHSNQNW
jgi:hypothetical protein